MKEISPREARELKRVSLRKAAGMLGITHAYLSALELGHKTLSDDWADKIAKTYGMAGEYKLIQPLPEDKENFVEWQQNQIKWWDSRFVLPMIPAVTRLITDLYVEPVFSSARWTPKRQGPLLQAFLNEPDSRGMLLMGPTGTGKSFFLRMLTLQMDKLLSGGKYNYVPLLISLGELDLRKGSFVQAVVDYYLRHGYEGSALQLEKYIQNLIQKGVALFLFDGLDEIPDLAQRAQTFARLQLCFEDLLRKKGNRIVISGRDEAFFDRDRSYEGFQVVNLDRWGPKQMHLACSRWSWSSDAEAERFWLAIQSNDSLFHLARWPLLFHLLTTLYSASGLKPFQELTGLCEACCEVLENSWYSARRAYFPVSGDPQNPLEVISWLKWKHFLIYLMEQVIRESTSTSTSRTVKLSFTPAEIEQAWEGFLISKGVARTSVDFLRFENLISNQNRIGPINLHRRIDVVDGERKVVDEVQFLDPLFAYYYLAKALINNPERIETFISTHVRDEHWVQVISLAVQELGRSDRTYENQFGEKLIAQLLCLDDELGLEHTHNVGNFGRFAAMRSIATYSFDRYWDQVIEPCLEQYLNSNFEDVVSKAFEILGEFSTFARVRNHFVQLFEQHCAGEGAESIYRQEKRWRLLAAVAKLGEKVDYAVEEWVSGINSFLATAKSHVSVEERINIRRLFWSLRQIGRLLRVENSSAQETSPNIETIAKVQAAIMAFVTYTQVYLQTQLETKRYSEHHLWDSLLAIIRSQSQLHYDANLKESVNRLCELIDNYFETLFSSYPHRKQLIQFLKVAFRHFYLLRDEISQSLLEKIQRITPSLDEPEQGELKTLIALAALGKSTGKERIDHSALFEKTFGPVTADSIRNWVQQISQHSSKDPVDFLRLGVAVFGLKTFFNCFESELLETPYDRKSVIKTLLKAMDVETNIDLESRETERIFTSPFSDYGVPLYDHLYNCITSLGARLPLSPVRRN